MQEKESGVSFLFLGDAEIHYFIDKLVEEDFWMNNIMMPKIYDMDHIRYSIDESTNKE